MTDAADPAYLARQYASDRNLTARQSIYAYQQPPRDPFRAALDLAAMRGDERVLDVGCGNGRGLAALTARAHTGPMIGLDRSPGVVESARAVCAAPLLVGDAQALPFGAARFDVVLAMHMLYHVPDRAVAIAELRRVLRPGGVALVVTNSVDHLREIDELIEATATAVLGANRVPPRRFLEFTCENGAAELERVFSIVVRHDRASQVVVPSVEPVVAYVRSMSAFVSDDGNELDGVLAEMTARVAAQIEHDGAFRIRTAVCCFVCR